MSSFLLGKLTFCSFLIVLHCPLLKELSNSLMVCDISGYLPRSSVISLSTGVAVTPEFKTIPEDNYEPRQDHRGSSLLYYRFALNSGDSQSCYTEHTRTVYSLGNDLYDMLACRIKALDLRAFNIVAPTA